MMNRIFQTGRPERSEGRSTTPSGALIVPPAPHPAAPHPAVLAADLGGTRMRIAVVMADGSLLARRERSTRPERGPDSVAADLAALLGAAEQDAAAAGLRLAPSAIVAATGPLTPDGVLVDPSNLDAAFHGYPLGAAVAAALGRPVRLGLDTHVALLGEVAFGALRGARDAIYLTVSTGVGGALLVGGRLVTGADGMAGEVGHLPVMAGGPRCGCGARGHLEAVASGPAIGAAGTRAARRGRSAILAALATRVPDGRLGGADVARAAAAGDPAAAAVLAAARAAMARAIVGLVALLNPERVVLGGGVVLADPAPWLAATRTALDTTGLVRPAARVSLTVAALGEDAGLIGCHPFATLLEARG